MPSSFFHLIFPYKWGQSCWVFFTFSFFLADIQHLLWFMPCKSSIVFACSRLHSSHSVCISVMNTPASPSFNSYPQDLRNSVSLVNHPIKDVLVAFPTLLPCLQLKTCLTFTFFQFWYKVINPNCKRCFLLHRSCVSCQAFAALCVFI